MYHFRPNGNAIEKMHTALSMAHRVLLDDDPIQLTPLLKMEMNKVFRSNKCFILFILSFIWNVRHSITRHISMRYEMMTKTCLAFGHLFALDFSLSHSAVCFLLLFSLNKFKSFVGSFFRRNFRLKCVWMFWPIVSNRFFSPYLLWTDCTFTILFFLSILFDRIV